MRALREEADRRKRDNPCTALLVAQAVIDTAAVWQNQQTKAVALHIEAEARRLLSQHKAALDLFKRAASLYRALGLELEAARVAVGQIDTMMYLGQHEEALTLANWASDIFHVAGDQLSLGKMVMNQGNIFARLGHFAQARDSHAKARTIFTALDDDHHLAMTNLNDAITLTFLDDFRQAESMFKQARDHFESEKMASAVAQVDLNLAYLYFAQGSYQRALATFNQARGVYAAQDNEADIAYVDMHRSDTYLALNLWHEALQWARLARPVFEKAGMQWETALLWLNEAAALAHLDDDTSPADALDKARQVFLRERNEVWLAATDLYQAIFDWRSGALESAREHALRARDAFSQAVRQVGLHSRVAQCEIVLGEVALAEGEIEHAAKHFKQGLERLEHTDVPAVCFACLYGLGRTEQLKGEIETALEYYRWAVAVIERLQAAIGAEDYKIAFLSDKLQVYEALIMLSMDVGTPEALNEAFETVEQAKGRALLDALAREPVGETDFPAEAALLAEMEHVRSELNWYYNRLNMPQPEGEAPSVEAVKRLTEAIARRERALKKLLNRWRSPDLAAAPRNPIWTVMPDQIKAALPTDALLLEFYTARDQVIAFGLDRETMWTQQLPTSCSQVADGLAQLRFQINKFGYGPAYRGRHAGALRQGTDESLRRLYDALLAPIAERLTAQTVIIVPHGVLHYVPFQALFDGQHYVIEKKTISYAPSATILHRVLTSEEGTNGRPPLIVGLPDETIPQARAEAEAIAALFPEADVHLGERATVESLMRNQERPLFLHLSTHATFRADNPLFSALKLADGWVSVNDLYGMAGSAPLVTLSACETGRSQVAVGDELVGLCRGFFSAGARSLVVSLWMVDDSSTARLMTRFYEELRAGQPVNHALATAQLAIKEEKGHPYYWASFILTGDINMHLTQ